MVFLPYQILPTFSKPHIDPTEQHPEFAEMVTDESISRVKQDKVPFKILDAVDEFVDFIKSKDL